MESRLVSKGANMIGEVARCTCPNRQPGMSSMFSQVCQPEFPGTHVNIGETPLLKVVI